MRVVRTKYQVGNHIEEMGLSAAVDDVNSLGIARFDVTSMVAWREKKTLERMKMDAYQRAVVGIHGHRVVRFWMPPVSLVTRKLMCTVMYTTRYIIENFRISKARI